MGLLDRITRTKLTKTARKENIKIFVSQSLKASKKKKPTSKLS